MNDYIGNELELFKHAHNWKKYYSKFFKHLLKGDVLEVGAGIGETTRLLCDGTQNSWVCLEPDGKLSSEIIKKREQGYLSPIVDVKTDTLSGMDNNRKFDAIIYIDVIEHIENDVEELKRAGNHLKAGGHLIILVPAHQFLFSPFDKAIGHFRRYNKQRLNFAAPPELKKVRLIYLDSVGLLASLANKWFLKQDYPGIKQIKFWDNYIIPVSRIADSIFRFTAGKTVVGVWRK